MGVNISNVTEKVDLIIVGAGPSGLSTALHLIQKDKSWLNRFIVLEKSNHPRQKLCGGGITRYGLWTMKNLNIPFPPNIPYTIVDDINITYKNTTIHIKGKPLFLIFDRMTFDNFLYNIAIERGIHIHTEETVQNITKTTNGVLIKTDKKTYEAKMIVGADGSKGIVRRFVAHNPNHRSVARVLEFTTTGDIQSHLFTQRQALFDFTPVSENLQGYIWQFPSLVNGEPTFNIGIYDARINKNGSKASLIPLLMKWLDKHSIPETKPNIMGHPIHGFHPMNFFSAPRIILIGDAAGADTLFGEGIAPALGYGSFAAKYIQEAFQENNFDFRSYRRELLFSKVGRYLFIRWLGAEVLYRFCKSNTFDRVILFLGKWIAAVWQPKPMDGITETLTDPFSQISTNQNEN